MTTDDLLARAEALPRRDLAYDEWWDLSRDMWPELIAEIKRLRVELQSYIEHEEQTHKRLSAILGEGDSLEELAKQQADYVARLEAAYLDEARENIQATKEFLQEQQTPEEYQAEIDRLARAALARVRGDE